MLDAARTTTERRLLRVCLDCFRAVLADARPEAAAPVVAFLGELLDDPARRRMRYRVLLTAAWIGRDSHTRAEVQRAIEHLSTLTP